MRKLMVVGVLAILGSAGCIYHESELPLDVFDGEGGGDARPTGSRAFSEPLPTLRESNLRPFLRGQALFDLEWSPSDIGPVFNSISCAACHADNGRAAPDGEGILYRLSAADGGADPIYGGQLQPQGIREVPGEGQVLITEREIRGEYADGTPYTLVEPVYRFVDLAYGPLSAGFLYSPRIAQQMVGLGLLEALSEEEILANEDPDDRDGDGISGRANWVDDVTTGGTALGRFGWKANQPTLVQQNAGAFNGDLGMTSDLFPESPCTSQQAICEDMDIPGRELREDELADLTLFTQLLAPPGRKEWTSDKVVRGEALFEEMGCQSCHVESWTTGTHPLRELSFQNIRPYTDLLLHDMGPELADGRADGLANGREWRTPPLWGIGHIEEVNGHTRLMHDGRARNIEEAILWHGGEGERSRGAFEKATAEERAALLAFLETL